MTHTDLAAAAEELRDVVRLSAELLKIAPSHLPISAQAKLGSINTMTASVASRLHAASTADRKTETKEAKIDHRKGMDV